MPDFFFDKYYWTRKRILNQTNICWKTYFVKDRLFDMISYLFRIWIWKIWKKKFSPIISISVEA